MRKQILPLSSLLSFAASLALPTNDTTTNFGPLTFEALAWNGFQHIENYAPSSVRPYLELYDLTTVAQPPFSLPRNKPNNIRVRAADVLTKRLWSAESTQNPPAFRLSDRPLDDRDAEWVSFKFPQGLWPYTYDRAVEYIQKSTRQTNLDSCRVGIPPRDPFRNPPSSVLWICSSPTAPRDDLYVLKVSNGAVGRFSWADMGVDYPTDLVANSSTVAWAT